MKLLLHGIPIVMLAMWGLSQPSAQAVITWDITYNDVVNNTEFGFDDPTLGATRQSTFESALAYVNSVVDEPGTVELTVNESDDLPTANTLASAGSYFFTGPNGFHNGLVFDHATTGADPWTGGPDGTAKFNFGKTWNSDLDAPTGSEFDLFTVSLHEITHALGFLSLLTGSGVSAISGGDPGVFSVYDSYLELGDGSALLATGGDFVGTTADLTSNDVYFDAPNATAANGGNPVPIYAPSTYSSGSSISHITTAGAVMNYSIAPGVEKRTYTPVELAILADLGWTVIPEPATAVLLGLLAVMSRGLRHRRG